MILKHPQWKRSDLKNVRKSCSEYSERNVYTASVALGRPTPPQTTPNNRRRLQAAGAHGLTGVIEEADEAHPFRLATSPSRSFLNTSFNETPSSQAREGAPSVMIHPADAASLGIADGDAVTLGNMRGETTLTAKLFDGLRRGVLIAESIQPNKAHIGGRGINTLTGGEAVAPIGGAAFHDNKVWLKKATPSVVANG